MDSDRQRLAAFEQKMEDLVKKQTRLKKKEHRGTITEEEEIDLAGIGLLLAEAKDDKKYYHELIKLAMKDEPPVTKSFSEANSEWIEAVTGVNTAYRKWTGYTLDVHIQPRPGFQTKFEEVAQAFHQLKQAGRRIFLNLFLSDIILRQEFGGALLIFPELQLTVESNGPKKRKLNGITDYTVGFGKGKDIIDNSIPREVNLVAVEAKTNIGEEDLWQCVAEAASLYKIRVDAAKTNKSVWGILSNAIQWQFVLIDEDGLLWRSEEFLLDLRSYNESKVLHVYRFLHYIVKCCYEAFTPPPSMTQSVLSLNQCNDVSE
jgi:hypothetical protein